MSPLVSSSAHCSSSRLALDVQPSSDSAIDCITSCSERLNNTGRVPWHERVTKFFTSRPREESNAQRDNIQRPLVLTSSTRPSRFCMKPVRTQAYRTYKGSLFVPGSNVACDYDPPSDHSNYTNTVTPAAIVKISQRPRCVSRCNSMAEPCPSLVRVRSASRSLEDPQWSRFLSPRVGLSFNYSLIGATVSIT